MAKFSELLEDYATSALFTAKIIAPNKYPDAACAFKILNGWILLQVPHSLNHWFEIEGWQQVIYFFCVLLQSLFFSYFINKKLITIIVYYIPGTVVKNFTNYLESYDLGMTILSL